MPWPRILVGLYGLFNIAVGAEAYASKQSLPSLIAGSAIGILLLVCFALVPKQPRWSYIGATVLALFVAGRFLPGAFGDTGKVWPNLVLGVVAIAVVVLLSMAHMIARKKASA